MSYRISICKRNTGNGIIWEKLRRGRGGVQVQDPTAYFLALCVGILYFMPCGLLISGPNTAGFGSNFVYSVPSRGIYHAVLALSRVIVRYLLYEGKSERKASLSKVCITYFGISDLVQFITELQLFN